MNQSASATARALIEAGRDLFARHGYDGASVRMITQRARANLGAITYHFGSKSAFHDRVIDETIGPFAERVVAAACAEGAPLDRVEGVVRTYFEYLLRHPELPRFLLQGLVLRDRPPVAALKHLRRILGALTALVVEGQADGTIREGLPVVLGLGTTSQAIHLAVAHRALAAAAGLDLTDDGVREEVARNLVRSARNGLAAGAAGEEAEP